MTRLASLTLVLAAACGTAPTSSTPQALSFAPYSVPQATSRDVFVGGHGDVVVMSNRISRDGGATWRQIDPRLGQLSRVAVTGTTVTLYATSSGLARWDLATDAVTPVAGAPAFATDRTWRTDPAGRLFVFDPVQNTIAMETSGAWTTAALPKPTETELAPYINDLESNGQTVLTVSAWGVHRSRDGGATWELVQIVPGAGRDLLVLADGRFLLFGGATSYVFDATGAPAGTVAGVTADLGDASACDDGAIVVHDKLSRDLGATWRPLIPSGDLTPIVERVGCAGGRYWLLARSDAWGYRLVSITAAGALAAGNWEGDTTWAGGGPPISRSSDGTFLVAGLAWRDGDPAWRLREAPPRAWASGDMAFGVTKDKFFASHDEGATWSARPQANFAVEQADAFARGADGSLLVSMFSGQSGGDIDTWHASVWKSSDEGATWTSSYDARAQRVPGQIATGEIHRFVGLAADGAWVATDAVSRDAGATWTATDVKTDRSPAYLTPSGQLVATLPTSSAADDVWRVYDKAGEGELIATYHLEVAGNPVAASTLSVAFDDAGYAYIAGGSPYIQVWRSTQPID